MTAKSQCRLPGRLHPKTRSTAQREDPHILPTTMPQIKDSAALTVPWLEGQIPWPAYIHTDIPSINTQNQSGHQTHRINRKDPSAKRFEWVCPTLSANHDSPQGVGIVTVELRPAWHWWGSTPHRCSFLAASAQAAEASCFVQTLLDSFRTEWYNSTHTSDQTTKDGREVGKLRRPTCFCWQRVSPTHFFPTFSCHPALPCYDMQDLDLAERLSGERRWVLWSPTPA